MKEKIQVTHGGAGSAIMGLHAYILREILLSKADAQKRKVQGPSILLRGHQHRMFMIQDDAGIYGVLNGCWEYTTPFMVKKSANVSPSIGATVIEVEYKGKKITIVVIGDTHIGSIYGLAHPSHVADNRNNAFLEWVFKSWADFCKKYKNPDYLILIGDLADGSQVMTYGVDALVTDTDAQVAMAKELLEMLIGDKTITYGINGSGYHGGERQATCIDRRITEAVGGEYKGNIFEFEVESDKTKIFREEYPIPEDVRQAMNGYEVLKYKRSREQEEKSKRIHEELRESERQAFCGKNSH